MSKNQQKERKIQKVQNDSKNDHDSKRKTGKTHQQRLVIEEESGRRRR